MIKAPPAKRQVLYYLPVCLAREAVNNDIPL